MEYTNSKNVTKKQQDVKQQSTAIRVEPKLKNSILKELESLNKNKKGSKRITISDLIHKSLSLLSDTERNQLTAQSVTGEDRQSTAFSNYKKKNKECTKSQFIDLLLYKKIEINDHLPPEMQLQNK